MADRAVSKLKTILRKIDKGVVPSNISFKEEVLTKESLEPLRGFQFDCVEVKDSDLDALSSLPPAKIYSLNASQIDKFDSLNLYDSMFRRVEFVRCLTTIPDLMFMPSVYNFIGVVDTPILSAKGMRDHHIVFDPACNEGKHYKYSHYFSACFEGLNKRFLKSMLDNPPEDITYINPENILDYKGEPAYKIGWNSRFYNRLYLKRANGNGKLVQQIEHMWYEIANTEIGGKVLMDV